MLPEGAAGQTPHRTEATLLSVDEALAQLPLCLR